MSRSLSFASRCRHFLRTLLTPAGVGAGRAAQSGSFMSTAAGVSLTVSPSKARLPVSISNSSLRLGDLLRKRKRFFEWKRARRDPRIEAFALDQLHGEEVAG